MKYCSCHKQTYMDFLQECPICAGELLGKQNIPKPKPKIDTKKTVLRLRKKKSQGSLF